MLIQECATTMANHSKLELSQLKMEQYNGLLIAMLHMNPGHLANICRGYI